MSSNFIMTASGLAVPTGIIKEPLPGQTLLLAHMDNETKDATGRNITRNTGFFSADVKKMGSAALRIGSNMAVEYATSTGYRIGQQDFTVELWYYPLSFPIAGSGLIEAGYVIPDEQRGWHLGHLKTGMIVAGNARHNLVYSPAGLITLNEWQHIAFTRKGTTLALWHNGKLVASSTNGDSINETISGERPWTIGYASVGSPSNNYSLPTGGGKTSGSADGYVDEVRVVRGQALFDSDFVPSTVPYSHPI